MLSDAARDALYDIRDHAIYAKEFVAGIDFDTFKQDCKTFFAATRALEIISEAARRLPEELRARHPSGPIPAFASACSTLQVQRTSL